MENARKEDNQESLPVGVFEIPGEPAVVINGVPPLEIPNDGNLVPCEILNDTESHQNIIFGEWLVGREVQKLFGEKLYNGKVTKFDKESGWFGVLYDDGDYEDFEWRELEPLLQPLDITIPLKTLASKVIKMQKNSKESGTSVFRPSHTKPNK